MVELSEKRIATLNYAKTHNGVTLREASTHIYSHKSTASDSLKILTEENYLEVIKDTPINSSYNKLWVLSKKGKKILEALNA